jgi:flagellar hook-associated protein 3 FlgL
MTIRTTNAQLRTVFLEAVRDQREEVSRLQQQIGTNRKILSPSDDPDGTVRAMGLRTALARFEQLQTTFETSRRHLTVLDSTLTQISGLLLEAKTIAVQGGNDTSSANDRALLAAQVDGLIRDLGALANTRMDGAYLFGGTDTGTPPYTLTETDGVLAAVTPNPSPTADRVKDLGHGETVAVNMPGARVFAQGTDTFAMLIGLRDALNANDAGAIRSAIDAVDRAIDQTSHASVEVGNRLRRLELMRQQAEEEQLTMQSAQSAVEDVDLAETLLRLRATESVLESALSVGSRLLPQTLLDFLR